MRCNSIIFLFLSGMWCNVRAQNVVFTAIPSLNKIGVQDQVQVQYLVKNAVDLKSISPGQFADFTIVQGPFQFQSTNTVTIGSKSVQTHDISLTYILQPKQAGTFTLLPASAKDAAGNVYTSNPVLIQVVPGTLIQSKIAPRKQIRYDDFGTVVR